MFFPSFCEKKQPESSVINNADSNLNTSVFSKSPMQSTTVGSEFSDALYSHFCNHKSSCKVCEASESLSLADAQKLLEIHKKVQDSGKYNFQHCRIRVNEKINVDYMRILLRDYQDLQVCDLLEFGFPLGF